MTHFSPHKFYSFLQGTYGKPPVYWKRPLLTIMLVLATTIWGYAQSTRITGQVTSDEDGAPIPGATVLVQGTTNGTITDVDGHYSLNVDDPNGVLVFSYVGYLSEEISINNRSVVDVSLVTDITELMEVVVVGYGTQKKIDLTGSVGSIEGENISERGTVSPLQAVQGQVAGVDISASSGRAGSGYDIQIRGQNSLAGGDPLYVVDGVIVDNINFINPQDIARLDILKDASSTAIYGSRGSNGVVLVTTKQGANIKGGTTISYDGYYGIRQNVRKPDFMSGDQWWEFRQNAYITGALEEGTPYDSSVGGVSSSELLADRLANQEYTDWSDYFLQTGSQQNHWLTVSGISESGKMNYVVGGGYQEETGNLKKDWFNRYNFKASIDHEINDTWSAGANFNFSMTEIERGSELAVTNAYRMSPLVSPYDANGELLYQPAKYEGISFTSSVNPLMENKYSEDNTKRYYGFGSIYLQYAPLDWLDVRTTFSPRLKYERRGRYWGSLTEKRQKEDPAARRDTEQSFAYIWDNQLNATKEFGEHSFNFTGLFSLQMDRDEEEYISVENLPFNSSYYNLGSAADILEVGSGFSKETLVSYMARLNYSFRDRYLVTVSNRWDGSSLLAEGHKWASFPSAAVAWRVSEEGFLKNSNVLSNLKARLSYGYTGNNNIDPYSTQALASVQTYYNFGDDPAKGFAPSGIVNQSLTWERTREFNFGIDYGFLRGRISGSIDLYDKLSEELLIERDLPFETGWESLVDNSGSVSNKGIELYLRTINIDNGDFSWSTTFNFAKNNNEIVELLGGSVDRIITDDENWFVGSEIGANYTYVFDGIWQESEREEALKYGQSPGQAKVKDINKNDKIDEEDRRIIGSINPDWTGGFSTQLTYKGFDLSASLFARQGIQVYSPFHAEFTNLDDRGRAKLDMNYYMPENAVTSTRISNEYPQPKNLGPWWGSDGVGYYKDASFVKVQNILLGYNFSQKFLENKGIKSLRLYVNVLNPFVWTAYNGFDPEWAGEDLVDTGNSFVTYQMGVNVKF